MSACQDNLNSLRLLLHRIQKFAFSVKTIRLHDNDTITTISFSDLSTLETFFGSYRFLSFSYRCKMKMQRKVCGFDENDMKTYSCRRGLRVLMNPCIMRWLRGCVFQNFVFSRLHKKMERIENDKNQRKSIVCVTRSFASFLVVASFSKVIILIENDHRF